MFYYLSVIGILMTPPSQGVIENSVTGSFDNLAACMKYKNIIEETVAQAPSAVILQSECKTKDKDKGKVT
jgi:hypothetical protein